MSRSFASKPEYAPPFRSGGYYFTSSPTSAGTSASHGIGVLRVVPFIVHRAVSITRLGAEVSTAGEAGSKVRLGCYADSDGYPSTLVVDAGQINGDSATTQELTVAVSLNPGLYWFGAVVQTVTTTQPTLRIGLNWSPPIPVWNSSSLPTAGAAATGLSATSINGALPASFPAGASGAGLAARVFLKVA